jgi:hypothetical protein
MGHFSLDLSQVVPSTNASKRTATGLRLPYGHGAVRERVEVDLDNQPLTMTAHLLAKGA